MFLPSSLHAFRGLKYDYIPPHRGWFGFLIKSQLNCPPQNASDYYCSCRLASLPPRKGNSVPPRQPEKRKIFRRKFQPEERQVVTAAKESFQRNNRAGRAFTYPNLSKQSKVYIKAVFAPGQLIAPGNSQNLRVPCWFPKVINTQTSNVSERSLNNPRLHFAPSCHSSIFRS